MARQPLAFAPCAVIAAAFAMLVAGVARANAVGRTQSYLTPGDPLAHSASGADRGAAGVPRSRGATPPSAVFLFTRED